MEPTLQQAIQAIKAGDKETGRKLLADILQADLDNELAWLWMSSVVDSAEQQRKYLEQVLKINPDNRAAQKGLAVLNQKLAEQAQQNKTPAAETEAQSGGSLGARLAAKNKNKTDQPEQPRLAAAPAPPASSARPEPAASVPAEPPPDQVTEVSLARPDQAETAPVLPPEILETPQPPTPEEPEPAATTAERISEIRQQFMQPPTAPVPLALYRLQQFWQTERGKLVIGGGLVGLLLVCVGCAVCSLVFRPMMAQQPTQTTILDTVALTATATPPPPAPTSTPGPSPTPTLSPTPTSTGTPVVPPTATVTPTATRTPIPDRNLQTAQVVGVVEGDIIDVIFGNEVRRVKYILVNAPALNDPQVGTEPFGQEALELNRRLVEGQTVTLEKDISETDPSGYLLRYVYIGDLMVNEELLRQGLARVELIPPDLKYGARFQAIEQTAQAANIGIWSLE